MSVSFEQCLEQIVETRDEESGILVEVIEGSVLFRLCRRCQVECDESTLYSVPLETYLQITANHHLEKQINDCNGCDKCEYMTNDRDQNMNHNNANHNHSNATDDNNTDHHSDHNGPNYDNNNNSNYCHNEDHPDCHTCRHECDLIENMEENGYVDATEFVDCRMVYLPPDGTFALFAGPICAASGTKTKIGVFSQEKCNSEWERDKDVDDLLDGMKLSYHLLRKTYDGGFCMPCGYAECEACNSNVESQCLDLLAESSEYNPMPSTSPAPSDSLEPSPMPSSSQAPTSAPFDFSLVFDMCIEDSVMVDLTLGSFPTRNYFARIKVCASDNCPFCSGQHHEEQLLVIDLDEYVPLAAEHERRLIDEKCRTCQVECIIEEEPRLTVDCETCVSECEAYFNMEENGYLDASTFSECQMIYDPQDDSLGALFAAPMCSNDGTEITIGVFSDEDCQILVQDQNVEDYLVDEHYNHFKLSFEVLEAIYSTETCTECLVADYNGGYQVSGYCEHILEHAVEYVAQSPAPSLEPSLSPSEVSSATLTTSFHPSVVPSGVSSRSSSETKLVTDASLAPESEAASSSTPWVPIMFVAVQFLMAGVSAAL